MFCIGPDDIGDVAECRMEVRPKDDAPALKTYHSIPKLQHIEMRNHVVDLLNKGWTTWSKSSYSSLIVAVRKKDGGLRLHCNNQLLILKTVPDCHQIPRIQNALDNLFQKK